MAGEKRKKDFFGEEGQEGNRPVGAGIKTVAMGWGQEEVIKETPPTSQVETNQPSLRIKKGLGYFVKNSSL